MDVGSFQSVDRISNLPDNVMDNILMHLTLRDAAKTSILAKQWRHKWHHLPQLIFDYTLWQYSERNDELARLKFVQIIYQVLLRHQGPIAKFSLNIPKLGVRSEIDPLIYVLSKSNVEEFALISTGLEKYKLPSIIFKFFQLKHLCLHYCVINCPLGFKGFSRLIRLELEYVTIEVGELANLISRCPLLEQLVLNIRDQPGHLEIDAPMLKQFDLICDKTSICFKNSPLLAIVSVGTNEGAYFEDRFLNFVEFFYSVPALQELQMDNFFMKYLNEDEVQTNITALFKNLKTLNLSPVRLDYPDEFSALLFLIKSCFNLEELKMEIFVDSDGLIPVKMLLEELDYSNVLLHHLREVKLKCFESSFVEMALVKLLLEKSPMMKRMIISTPFDRFDEIQIWTLEELNKFSRASPNAKVICEGRVG